MSIAIGGVLDALLALALVALALAVVRGRPFRAIVLFVVFGLVMALVWARLAAPDLALAEAAIGAGLTGALLLVTHRRLQVEAQAREQAPLRRRSQLLALPVALLAAVLVGALGFNALELPPGDATAGSLARDALPALGIDSAVTAVLLGFRGYDTVLELAVLLAAWLGARALAPRPPPPLPGSEAEVPLVPALLAAVVPLTVLAGGHLLHAGTHAAGGAFQAGAVLAAGGVLLALGGRLRPAVATAWPLRLVLVAGLAAFAGLGAGAGLFGAPPLSLPGHWAVLLVEAAMALSIAATLVLLFVGAGGVRLR